MSDNTEDEGGQKIFNINFNKTIGDVRIITEGLINTRFTHVYPDLLPIQDAKTVGELFTLIEESHRNLDKLGLFSEATSQLNRGLRNGDVDVIFRFKEKSTQYSVGANLNSKSHAALEFSGEVPGVFNTVNTFSLNVNTSGAKNNEISGSYYMPRIIGLPTFTGLFQLYSTQNDFVNYSSFHTYAKGLKFLLSNLNNRHKFIWESSIRDIYPIFNDQKRASEVVLRNAGRSIKNSLSYVYLLDNLKGDTIPLDGECTQINVETAIPGGDSQYFKLDYNMLLSRMIRDKLIAHLVFSLGYIYNFSPYSKKNNVLDNFHFTGSYGTFNSFKGFKFRGVGPFDYGLAFNSEKNDWVRNVDHVGGDYYADLQLSLYYPLNIIKSPVYVSKSITTHDHRPMLFGFINLGTLSSHSTKNRIYLQALEDMRLSIGFGLSFGLVHGCWMESYFAKPLLYKPTDAIDNFQIGMRFKHNL